MKAYIVLITLTVLFPVALAQMVADDYELTNRTQGILQQARTAIGATSPLQSLSVKGTVRRQVKYVEVSSPTEVEEKEKTLTSKLRVEFQFPDKFRVREQGSQVNGQGYELLAIVNNSEAWIYPQPIVPSTPENRRVVSVEDAEQNLIRQAQTARTNVSRFTVGLLLTAAPSIPLEFTYAGRITSEVGTNDVLTVREADGYKFLLLLDPQTHLPTMLNETVVMSQRVTVIPTGLGFDRRYNRAIFTRAREERLARSKPPHAVSVQMRLSDRRTVGGLNLPHRIKTYYNGQLVEEIEFDEFTFNRPINPKKFEENRPR